MIKFEDLENSLRYMKRLSVLYEREKDEKKKNEYLSCFRFGFDEFLKKSSEYYGSGFTLQEYIHMVIEEKKKGREVDEVHQRNSR